MASSQRHGADSMTLHAEPLTRRLIDFDGRQPAIEVAECGDRFGRPVVFFHGWPSAASQSLVFDRAAHAAGVRLIAPNRPGIGRSAPDPLHSVIGWQARVATVVDALAIGRFSVLGVSGGGPYALAAAGVLGRRVEACAAVSCAPPVDRSGRSIGWWLRAELRLRDRSPRTVAAMLAAARLFVRRRALVWAVFTRWAARGPREGAALRKGPAAEASFMAFREAIASPTSAVIADGDSLASPWGFSPADIAVPVCFWHGLRDRTTPWAFVQPVARSIPGARVVLGEDDGHHSMSMLRTEEILGWLVSRPSQPR
jgi:pimeloyl-ACP methyl ester carboxylesterase